MNAAIMPGAPARPGPNTPAGRAVAARSALADPEGATSHGLFARDVVLPHLGEDPGAYNELFLAFCDQLSAQNLLERHYVGKIAAASWSLRRWQAQVYGDPRLSEDKRLSKLEKVLRQETTLHRQIDQTVCLLNRDLPQLFARRAHALAELDATEADCKQEPELAADVERLARAADHTASLAPGFDRARLDNTQPAPHTQDCENEPPPVEEPSEHQRARDVSYVHPDGRPVYLQPDTWRALQNMRAHGEHDRAEEFEAHYRRRHLFHQTGDRQLLTNPARGRPNNASQTSPPQPDRPREPRSPSVTGTPPL